MSGIVGIVGESNSGMVGGQSGLPGTTLQATSAYGTADTTLGTTNNVWEDTVIVDSITPKFKDSLVWVFMSGVVDYSNNTGSTDAGVGMRVKRVITGGATDYPANLSVQEGTTNAHSIHYIGSGGNAYVNRAEQYSFIFVDAPATTSTVTYTWQGAPYSCTALVIGGAYTSRWFVHLQEMRGPIST